jgi:FixJ family two-component response regulator
MLTDHAMPHMTGAQLVRETSAAYPQMAVIIASGFAELPEDISTITRLRKPYAQADLADALANSRSGSRGGRPRPGGVVRPRASSAAPDRFSRPG